MWSGCITPQVYILICSQIVKNRVFALLPSKANQSLRPDDTDRQRSEEGLQQTLFQAVGKRKFYRSKVVCGDVVPVVVVVVVVVAVTAAQCPRGQVGCFGR